MSRGLVKHVLRGLAFAAVSAGTFVTVFVFPTLVSDYQLGETMLAVILGGAGLIALAAPSYGIAYYIVLWREEVEGSERSGIGALVTIAVLQAVVLIPFTVMVGPQIARVFPLESHFDVWVSLTVAAGALVGVIVASSIVLAAKLVRRALTTRWSGRAVRAAQRER